MGNVVNLSCVYFLLFVLVVGGDVAVDDVVDDVVDDLVGRDVDLGGGVADRRVKRRRRVCGLKNRREKCFLFV